MKIEYLHQQGGYIHQGPSGTTYEFAPDADGRRIAEVTDPTDQARFLSITGLQGQPLFVSLETAEPASEPVTEPDEKPARHRKAR
jgi:hypothetical protein